MIQEREDIAGRGEVECVCYAHASNINFVVSNNHTEFKFLDDIAIMLSYYHILSICVLHRKIDMEEATKFYEKINGIKTKSSSHSFEKKFDISCKYFEEKGYMDILELR